MTTRVRSGALEFVAAIAGAAVLAATYAPTAWWLLVVPLFAVLLRAVDGVSGGVAFRRGYLFGLAFLLINLEWVYTSASRHLGAVILAVGVALCAVEAVFIALAAVAFAIASRRSALAWVLGAPAAYALLELARSSGPLGLPLAQLGTTQVPGTFAWLLALGGVPLTTAFVLMLAAMLALAARERPRSAQGTIAAVAGIVIFAAVVGAAWHGSATAAGARTLARLGIVQGGRIDDGRTFLQGARHYAEVTRGLPGDVDYALWPEGVIFLTDASAGAQRDAALQAAAHLGRPVVVGATTATGGVSHNDLLELRGPNALRSLYTKRRLVPFGEYQPFAFGAAARRTYGVGGSSAAITLPGFAPFGALICYEVAFPDLARDSVGAGAAYLVAVLNDTWFDGTPGPEQLTQLLQARAIEEGETIVQADAVAPSGAVDATGAWILAPLLHDGTQVVRVAAGIATPYRRFGATPTLIALLACLVTFILPAKRAKQV